MKLNNKKAFNILFNQLIAPCVVSINVFIACFILLNQLNIERDAILIFSGIVAGWMFNQTPITLKSFNKKNNKS